MTALLALIVIVCLGVIATLLARRPSSSAAAPELMQILGHLARLESGQASAVELTRRVDETHRTLDVVRARLEERGQRDEVVQATIRRIESMFAGSAARGKAGENVILDALRALPADMLRSNFRVNGKVVEYGIELSDGRVLPVDSKWPSADLLARCDQDLPPGEREALVRELRRETLSRVREVASYIDSRSTAPYAVAAVPDAVLALCATVHAEAFKHGVLLMSYSSTLPYLLLLYRLHAQYSRSLDLDQLAARLSDLGRHMSDLDRLLENSVLRGGKMVVNGAGEAQEIVAKMRRAVTALETPLDDAPRAGLPPPTLAEGKPAREIEEIVA
ncbi:MAG: DNA recombination protein RmuC [Dehalococcoidia bacterium]|nr:DNA recombination protein RmuC [Dehalococcoidia bacterium]